MKDLMQVDWSMIPAPIDDGAARHLVQKQLPGISLMDTGGNLVDLSKLTGLTIVYAYPRTGVPGIPSFNGWDTIPGARGCTPQSCAFRDHFKELTALGVNNLFGLSTQDSVYQKEAAIRLHLPFSILSDEALFLTKALQLPIFEVDGLQLLKRLTMVIKDGVIQHVFYPVFPPDNNASDVIGWLKFNS